MIVWLEETLSALKVRHWICYGSLLSMARMRGISPWDYDADYCFVLDDEHLLRNASAAAARVGFALEAHYAPPNPPMWRLFYSYTNRLHIDLYGHFWVRRHGANDDDNDGSSSSGGGGGDGVPWKLTKDLLYLPDGQMVLEYDEVFPTARWRALHALVDVHVPRNASDVLHRYYGETCMDETRYHESLCAERSACATRRHAAEAKFKGKWRFQ